MSRMSQLGIKQIYLMEQAMSEIIKNYEKNQIQEILKNSKVTDFSPGDTIKVNIKIKEGDKERVQAFQGVCIAKKNNNLNSSFTVRKISSGEGVERVFPLYSNIIESIERIKTGDVRRAKLYYLRNLSGKKARISERTDGRNYDDNQFESIAEVVEPTGEEKTEEEVNPSSDVTKDAPIVASEESSKTEAPAVHVTDESPVEAKETPSDSEVKKEETEAK